MEDDQRDALGLIAVLHNIVDSSSSSSDSEEDDFIDEELIALDDHQQINRHQIPRVEDFIERVVNRYTAEEFRQTYRFMTICYNIIINYQYSILLPKTIDIFYT